MANSIYSSVEGYNALRHQSNANQGSYYKSDRHFLMRDEVAKEFNSYRNWRQFDLALPKLWDDSGKLKQGAGVWHPQGLGLKSLFNNTAAVWSKEGSGGVRTIMNMPLLDQPDVRQNLRNRTDCSIKKLVEESENGHMGRAIYNYSDFMYCKYLGRIPNNYMITLRKFPMPCSDHINYSGQGEYDEGKNSHLPDMGRLITWMGTPGNEMSNILSYKYTIPWQKNEAPQDEIPSAIGGSPGGGTMGQLFGALDGTFASSIKSSGGYGYSGDSNWLASSMGWSDSGGGISRNADLSNNNRMVSSNQNAIKYVMVPGGKADGLGFTHDINLQFDYELRSYDGVNGRSAMLDLLGNILMVTYLQGHFFRGSYRGGGQSTSNLYANLDIFKNKEATSSPAAFMNSMFTSLKQIAEGLGFKEGQSPREALKNIGTNLFSMLANGLINKMGRPQMFACTSLISPTPTGQWHLTVGNPRNPILSIGNLILKEGTIEHYGPLGLDDFPTGLRVKVTLEHAKPRDSVAIEQMYMQGNFRIYSPMGDKHIGVMYDSAKAVNKSGNANTADMGTAKTKSESKTTSKNFKARRDVYMKFFGTNDIKGISVAAGEALTGADSGSSSSSGSSGSKTESK